MTFKLQGRHFLTPKPNNMLECLHIFVREDLSSHIKIIRNFQTGRSFGYDLARLIFAFFMFLAILLIV